MHNRGQCDTNEKADVAPPSLRAHDDMVPALPQLSIVDGGSGSNVAKPKVSPGAEATLEDYVRLCERERSCVTRFGFQSIFMWQHNQRKYFLFLSRLGSVPKCTSARADAKLKTRTQE